jgi:hypothetical protein
MEAEGIGMFSFMLAGGLPYSDGGYLTSSIIRNGHRSPQGAWSSGRGRSSGGVVVVVAGNGIQHEKSLSLFCFVAWSFVFFFVEYKHRPSFTFVHWIR